MATIKQKKAFQKIVENGGNISKAMKEVGYSKNTAKTPQKLTTSKGFKALCDEYGFNEELIVSALVEDIQDKRNNRKAELELGAKLLGMLKDKERSQDLNVSIVNYEKLTDKGLMKIATEET